MKRLGIILTLLALCLTASAQKLTLDEAHRLSRENYPLIKRYDLISRTSQYTLGNISKGWLPQVSAEAQATLQSDVMALPDALKGMFTQQGMSVKGIGKDQYRVALSVNQTVFDGGSISARRKVAKSQTQVDEAQNDVNLYALRERVDGIFFSILLVNERLSLNKDMQRLLQSNEDKLRKLVKGGLATAADADALKAERLSAAQQQIQLETTRNALLRVLSVYVNRDVSAVERPSELAEAYSGAVNRPEMKLFNSQIELAKAQANALTSGLLPRLSVFAQGYYGYPGYNMFDDMFSRDWSWNGMVGAKLSWNIGALYTNKNDKRRLETLRQEIETARETFLFNTNLQSIQESEAVQGYRKMLAEDDEIIALRRSVRESAEAKLTHGVVDVNNLLQEITRENQASINRSTHEIEMLQHMYAVKRINN